MLFCVVVLTGSGLGDIWQMLSCISVASLVMLSNPMHFTVPGSVEARVVLSIAALHSVWVPSRNGSVESLVSRGCLLALE